MAKKIKVSSYIRKTHGAKRMAFKYFFRYALCSMRYAYLFLICALFLSSCAKPPHKNTFIMSGTYLEIISPYQEAAAIVHGEFKRLNNIFSFYDPASELSQLNQTYNKPFKASEELIGIIELSKEIYEETGGTFDISCGALYNFWKDLTKRDSIISFPSQQTIKQLKSLSGIDYIEIDSELKTVTIKQKGVKIDLSGIAKGYMVDKAIEKLKAAGVDSALINAGGDLYCLGKNRDKPWKIGIRSPKHPKSIIESETLIDKALVTSGTYEQFFNYNGQRYSHLVDPISGYPIKTNIVSISVISQSCAIADSLATSFFAMEPEWAKKFISHGPYELKVFIVKIVEGKERLEIIQ